MTISINNVNLILEYIDAMIKQNERVDKVLIGVILDCSNGLIQESREILDVA